jgi:hypothetical protein
MPHHTLLQETHSGVSDPDTTREPPYGHLPGQINASASTQQEQEPSVEPSVAKTTRKTWAEWEEIRPCFTQLYVEENYSVGRAADCVREVYDFIATCVYSSLLRGT